MLQQSKKFTCQNLSSIQSGTIPEKLVPCATDSQTPPASQTGMPHLNFRPSSKSRDTKSRTYQKSGLIKFR